MNTIQALRLVLSGKRICRKDNKMPNNIKYYCLSDKIDNVIDNDGFKTNPFNNLFWDEDLWEEYMEWNWKIGDKFHYKDNKVICEVLYADNEIIFYKYQTNYETDFNYLRKIQYENVVRV